MPYEGRSGGRHTPSVYSGYGKSSDHCPDDWVTTKVFFDGFASLSPMPSTGEYGFVFSPEFYCLGYEWDLKLYPHGSIECEESEKTISVFLRLRTRATVEVEYSLAVSDFIGTDNETVQETCKFDRAKERGRSHFLKRETALMYLTKEALVIDVRMRPAAHSSPFLDNPSKHLTFKEFFNDEDYADVVFEVGGEHVNTNQHKKAKHLPVKFFAHRLILKKAAPQLAELCLPSEKSPSLISLPAISSKTFEALLLYIYGYNIPNLGNNAEFVKDIIEVADKYGVISLKLMAEDCYASTITLTLDNVVEHFLFAEAKNCAYLKEKTLDFIVNNTAKLMKQRVLTNTTEGPSRSDILAAVARSQARAHYKRDKLDLFTMSITELRCKAYAKGLAVDGSRETLISAIEYSTEKEAEKDKEEVEDVLVI